MICCQCITAYENIINASSSDTKVEETPVDDALDDATYEVYETPRKRFNTSFEPVGVSPPVNLHGVPQHSRATSTKQKLDKVVDTYKSTIAEAYNVSQESDEESDAQWKAAELEWLHGAMREKLKTALYPENIQILILIPDKCGHESTRQNNLM